jgi:hypothetical protein
MRSALKRHRASAALALSLLAVVLSFTGAADAARQRLVDVVSKPKKHAVLKLGANAKFPAKAIPKVAAAQNADTVGGKTQEELTAACTAESVDLGTWCLMASPYPVPNEEIGKNDFFYATQKCAEEGGYLPTAAQLIGAAEQVKLASTLDDDRLTASIDEDPTDGRKDRREMSATLVTTQAGSSAAGSAGVSDGSRGDPKTGEPDPTPAPPSPAPESLQYVTVYDNRDRGGFAGSRPVSQPETFRCAFDKAQGQEAEEGE